jgi:alpha-1,2-mannosyltransferase
VLAVVTVGARLASGQYGSDFHGGIWTAAHAIAAGKSPYAPAIATVLQARHTAFIPPPLMALVAVPLTVLPFSVAVLVWSALCAAGLWASLRLLGVRDRRLVMVVMCSYPFVASLIFGDPDGLFALLLAIAWRYRDRTAGPVAAGVLIAAKLLAWPLVFWFVITRRPKAAITTVGTCLLAALASWALIGFDGLVSYPQLLSADAHAFASGSYSLFAAVTRAGGSTTAAYAVAVIGAGLVLLLTTRPGTETASAGLVGACIAGLLVSPLVELSYLTPVFVALAIGSPRIGSMVALSGMLWLAPPGLMPPGLADAQVALVLFALGGMALEAVRGGASRGAATGPCAAVRSMCGGGMLEATQTPGA